MVVEVESKEQARQIVPPLYRAETRNTKLLKYNWDDTRKETLDNKMDGALKFHKD